MTDHDMSQRQACRASGIARSTVRYKPVARDDSDLIATVPKMLAYVCSEMGGFQVFRPPFKIDPIPISPYWTDRQHNDPAHVWLRRTMADLLLDQDPFKDVKYW